MKQNLTIETILPAYTTAESVLCSTPLLKASCFAFKIGFSYKRRVMFENKTAKEPIRLEKIDHFAAQDNEPYPWHRSLYVCN